MLRPELAGAVAEAKATTTVPDMFISLRDALAHARITQVWTPTGEVDLNSDSGHRRLIGDGGDEVQAHDIRRGQPYCADPRLMARQ
eukprot:2026151-Pyramimonas_sp.AAC.1